MLVETQVPTIFTPSASTNSLLTLFGLQVLPTGDIRLTDLAKAESGCVHHSLLPVAVTALSLVTLPYPRSFARGRFPATRLVDIVALAPSMDLEERLALAETCSVELTASGTAAFVTHLLDVIERYDLEEFFGRDPNSQYANNIRPRGYNWRTEEDDPGAARRWRQAYQLLSPAHQMMVATILWLYRGGPDDKYWLARQKRNWRAAEAIPELRAAGALRDWAKLVALYPGW